VYLKQKKNFPLVPRILVLLIKKEIASVTS